MNKVVFLFGVLLFNTLILADCIVYENRAYAEAGYAAYEKECKAYGGGGSVFQGNISVSSPNNTCSGGYADDAYVLRVSCNTCNSTEMLSDIQGNKKYCKEQCKSAQMYCSHTLNSWGSNLSGSIKSCGLVDHTIPGCSESSSSANSSSSSTQSSSSSEENYSSSEEYGLESSSDGSCEYDYCEESSSSEVRSSSSEESSSSEIGMSSSSESNLVTCYTSDGNGGCKFSRYVSKVKPLMHGEPSLSENNMIFCEYKDNNIRVGYFADVGYPQLIEDPELPWYKCYYDEYNCGNLTSAEANPIPSLHNPFYQCYMSELDENGCKEKIGVSVYVDKNLQITEGTMNWLPQNVTREQIISMGDEIVRMERSMVVYYNDKRLGTGSLRNISPRNLAGAVDFCNDIISDYERRNKSSSSTQVSSSSEGSSSSVVESSSSEILFSSSSEKYPESSSCIIEESSSSSSVPEIFIADGSQEYTPEQIFNSGLENMEQGKCYSLNPERGSVSGWNISYNAQDSWWWREVDCETGEKTVESGIGVCAAFSGSMPTSTSSCYSYNGSCYKCDNSRDYVDCNADWLWKYNFPYHDWFKQVDCYEEEDDYICSDVASLQKKSSKGTITIDDGDEIKQNVLKETYYFDALGRSMRRKEAFSVKRPVYIIRQENENSQKRNISGSKYFKAMLKTISGSVSANSYASFTFRSNCTEKRYTTLYISIELTTPESSINTTLEGDDSALKNHESKHKAIYIDYGNKIWNEQMEVSSRSTNKGVCKLIKETYWTIVESAFRNMLNLQNVWDDEDSNNISHARIDVNYEISKLKKIWDNNPCN